MASRGCMLASSPTKSVLASSSSYRVLKISRTPHPTTTQYVTKRHLFSFFLLHSFCLSFSLSYGFPRTPHPSPRSTLCRAPRTLSPTPVPPSTRRLPPPCWSPDETLALIDAFRDKWYSLGRGNLKATHWQEVADALSHRCPNASPPKTLVQCHQGML